MDIYMVKWLHEMPIFTTPCRRARWDTWNQVLVHPIWILDDKVIPFGRSQEWVKLDLGTEGVGRPLWASGHMGPCPMATKLGQEPPHSPRSPREAMSTLGDIGRWPKGVGRRPKSPKPPLLRTHSRKHSLEQYGVLIYSGLRLVSTKGREGWSCRSMTWN
jgi:hypothetical protein